MNWPHNSETIVVFKSSRFRHVVSLTFLENRSIQRLSSLSFLLSLCLFFFLFRLCFFLFLLRADSFRLIFVRSLSTLWCVRTTTISWLSSGNVSKIKTTKESMRSSVVVLMAASSCTRAAQSSTTAHTVQRNCPLFQSFVIKVVKFRSNGLLLIILTPSTCKCTVNRCEFPLTATIAGWIRCVQWEMK